MKVSVSLPDPDVRFLDEYAKDQGLESRSAAVQKAVRLLRASDLSAAYERAWKESAADEGDAAAWEFTVGDGLVDEDRS